MDGKAVDVYDERGICEDEGKAIGKLRGCFLELNHTLYTLAVMCLLF